MNDKSYTGRFGSVADKMEKVTRLRVTPENARNTAILGSTTIALASQSFAKSGPEGALFGAGTAAIGTLTIAALVSVSVSIWPLVIIGAIGGILGALPKSGKISS